MESQFRPNTKPLRRSKETIGFSRMESQFPPNTKPLRRSKETIGFSRMESQFQPSSFLPERLDSIAAEAGGLSSRSLKYVSSLPRQVRSKPRGSLFNEKSPHAPGD